MASRGAGAKSKGSAFELKIAKQLTDWWGEGDFHRTPGSGSLHWAEDNRVSGDIIPPQDSTFNFSVECKDHSSTRLDQLVTSSGEFPSFWQQCAGDAAAFNKVPMLIFKMPRIKPWVVLPYVNKLFNSMVGWTPLVHTVLSYKNIRDEQQDFEVMSLPLDNLIKLAHPDQLVSYYKDCYWNILNELG